MQGVKLASHEVHAGWKTVATPLHSHRPLPADTAVKEEPASQPARPPIPALCYGHVACWHFQGGEGVDGEA